MELLIDFVPCNKPGILDIQISGIMNIEQNSLPENCLLNSS